MRKNNRKPLIIDELARGTDPIKVATQYGVTTSYVYHLDKGRREGNKVSDAEVRVPTGGLFKQDSVSSLRRHGGELDEEYLKDLRGQRGIQFYREMANDPIVTAVIQAMKMTIRRVQWYAVAPESGREEEVDFLNSCMNDMSNTFADFVDQALSMLIFGFAPFEAVYKPRKGNRVGMPGPRITKSRFDDGKIGWRKFALIGQDTLAPGRSWVFDDKDGSLKGLNQQPPPGIADQSVRFIPIEKMVLFRTTTERDNPEGKSILRAMFRPYYFKNNMEEVEAISAERLGAGFPVIYLGDDISKGNTSDSEMHEYARMIRNIRVDEQMGAVIPSPKMGIGTKDGRGVLLEFAAPPANSTIDFNEIIERHEKRIAMVGLAQMIHLGMGQYGSQSLATVTNDFFQLAVSAWTDSMRDTINRFAVFPLLRLNAMNTDDPVIIDHSSVSTPDLKTIGDYINKTVGAKVIEPDDQLEDSLRKIAGFPDKDQETVRSVMVEVDGDGGTRMDRSERTKMDEGEESEDDKDGRPPNQRNMRPKAEKPQEVKKPQARKPMRA